MQDRDQTLAFSRRIFGSALALLAVTNFVACGSNNPGDIPTSSSPSEVATSPLTSGGSTSASEASSTAGDPTGDKLPQPGDNKEWGGIKFHYVVNDKLGVRLGFYVPDGQEEKAGSGAGAGAWYYVGDKSLPTMVVDTEDKEYGATPMALANYSVSRRPECSADAVEVPGADAAARMDCKDSSEGLGGVSIYVQVGGMIYSVEVDRSQTGSATFEDQQNVADQLELRVLQ